MLSKKCNIVFRNVFHIYLNSKYGIPVVHAGEICVYTTPPTGNNNNVTPVRALTHEMQILLSRMDHDPQAPRELDGIEHLTRYSHSYKLSPGHIWSKWRLMVHEQEAALEYMHPGKAATRKGNKSIYRNQGRGIIGRKLVQDVEPRRTSC